MRYLAALLTLFLFALVLPPTPAHAESATPPVRSVVIIGVDGLSPRGLDEGDTPRMNELMERGSYTFRARGVFPTSSSPNWGSMIMGAGPEQHGVTSNDWRPWSRAILPQTGDDESWFPTIFRELRRQRPGAFIASVYDWGGFGVLYDKADVDLDADTQGPEATMERAVQTFREDRPHLLFIHIDHVDGAGHGQGWHTGAYFDAVKRADGLIGEMMDAISAEDAWDSTVVIVTSDHGGVGTAHGGETMAELEIPWIIAGAGVAPGREITRAVNTYDTACTAAYLLDLEPHPAWVGKPIREAMLSGGPEDGWRVKPYVPAPRLDPPGGVVTEDRVTVTLSSQDPGATIRYTLDGTEPTERSPIYRGPLMLTETQTVRARAFKGRGASRVTTDSYRLLSPASPRPVRYTYYEGAFRDALPDFGALTPVRTGFVPEIGLHFVERRADGFAVRFETTVNIEETGTYVLHLTSDDGSRLFLNGRKLIDNDGSHGPLERSGTIDLGAGAYRLVVEYFEEAGSEMVEVAITRPDRVRVPLTHSWLSRPSGG